MSSNVKSTVTKLGIPISCIAITKDNLILIGGGGGPGRFGIKNLLIFEYDFGNEQDAPTCISIEPKSKNAIVGVNSTCEDIKQGNNKCIRKFKLLLLENSKKISDSKDLSQYLKFATFDPNGKFFCFSNTDGLFGSQNFPKLNSRFSFSIPGNEILDADISNDSKLIATVSKNELKIIKSSNGKQVQSISDPHLKSGENASFRLCRYNRSKAFKNRLYTILNTNTRRKSYIVSWDTTKWKKILSKKISSSISCLSISNDGLKLAVGCANMEILILDAISLNIYYRFKNTHSFVITSISFTADDQYLISGSADETMR
ncbi:hypothetical protein BB560_003735, partial [Smittium megazygosporum]